MKERKDLSLLYWRENVDKLLAFNEKEVLKNTGSISHKQMKEKVNEIYNQFDQKRQAYEVEQADLEDLRYLEEKIKKKNDKK